MAVKLDKDDEVLLIPVAYCITSDSVSVESMDAKQTTAALDVPATFSVVLALLQEVVWHGEGWPAVQLDCDECGARGDVNNASLTT